LKQNIHVITKEKLEELGWNFDDFWNNRAMFSKKDGKLDGFTLFEHDGNWGIMDPYDKSFSLIYCNMTDKMIERFIDYVNTYERLMTNPTNYTLAEYLIIENNLKKIIEKMKKRG
jgi:hypothetical protein